MLKTSFGLNMCLFLLTQDKNWDINEILSFVYVMLKISFGLNMCLFLVTLDKNWDINEIFICLCNVKDMSFNSLSILLNDLQTVYEVLNDK